MQSITLPVNIPFVSILICLELGQLKCPFTLPCTLSNLATGFVKFPVQKNQVLTRVCIGVIWTIRHENDQRPYRGYIADKIAAFLRVCVTSLINLVKYLNYRLNEKNNLHGWHSKSNLATWEQPSSSVRSESVCRDLEYMKETADVFDYHINRTTGYSPQRPASLTIVLRCRNMDDPFIRRFYFHLRDVEQENGIEAPLLQKSSLFIHLVQISKSRKNHVKIYRSSWYKTQRNQPTATSQYMQSIFVDKVNWADWNQRYSYFQQAVWYASSRN